MSLGRIALLVMLSVQLSTPSCASAKTWFVERDGTGDFTVIQDAVNAAASGDTVKIGLGRFDEKYLVTCPGWSEYVRVFVTQQELTLIGSGPGTIIGPVNAYEPGQGDNKGIVTGDYWGNHFLRVENLHLENMRSGIYTGHEDVLEDVFEVNDCSFNGNEYGLTLLGNGGMAKINNCNFQNYTSDGTFIVAWDHIEMEIRNCVFQRRHDYYSTRAVGLSSTQNALIEDCEFIGGTSGLGTESGTYTLLKNCSFDDQLIGALAVTTGANMSIEGCHFSNQNKVLDTFSPNVNVEMTDSVIEDVADCSFHLSGIGTLTVNNCDLAKGDRGVVYLWEHINCPNPAYLNMTNNYWSTDNPDSISAWIYDRYDSEDCCFWVNFEPFHTETTPTEKQSLGGFRAMFR